MSIGLSVAMKAVPFLDLLDQEQEELVAQVLESPDEQSADAVMESTRRRLSVTIDSFVRSLPSVVRNDATAARAAAYALAGLADERIIHHPAGGLNRWGEKLLEFELYGSALAGQEIVKRARAAASGSAGATGAIGGETSDPGLLAPLYLAIFRAGFEGSLRGDTIGLTSLITALEEFVGGSRGRGADSVVDQRPSRVGLAPLPIAVIGIIAWLFSGIAMWTLFMSEPLAEADQLTDRITRGLPVDVGADELERSFGPSGLPPLSGLGGRNEQQVGVSRSAIPGYRSTDRKDSGEGGSSWLNSSSDAWDQALVSGASSTTAGSRAAGGGRSLSTAGPGMGISLAALPPNLFVVLLAAQRSASAMEEFLRSHGLPQNLPVLILEYESQLYHVLISGVYSTRQEADQAALGAAESYEGVSPWIQPLGQLQVAMARAEQLDSAN